MPPRTDSRVRRRHAGRRARGPARVDHRCDVAVPARGRHAAAGRCGSGDRPRRADGRRGNAGGRAQHAGPMARQGGCARRRTLTRADPASVAAPHGRSRGRREASDTGRMGRPTGRRGRPAGGWEMIERASDVRASLSDRGVTGAAADVLVRLGRHGRHAARVEYVRGLGDDCDVVAWALLDAIGVGGPGLTGRNDRAAPCAAAAARAASRRRTGGVDRRHRGSGGDPPRRAHGGPHGGGDPGQGSRTPRRAPRGRPCVGDRWSSAGPRGVRRGDRRAVDRRHRGRRARAAHGDRTGHRSVRASRASRSRRVGVVTPLQRGRPSPPDARREAEADRERARCSAAGRRVGGGGQPPFTGTRDRCGRASHTTGGYPPAATRTFRRGVRALGWRGG